MTEIIQSRRGFIAGLGALFIAAPAIVRATSIMPVKGYQSDFIGRQDFEFKFSGFYSVMPLQSFDFASWIIGYDILESQP